MTIWLSRELILAIHDEQIAEHGGSTGTRDEGLLESALALPLNRAGYCDPGMGELAALYAIAITRNHPFVDGNKRTAYVGLETFLRINGLVFPARDVECVVMMLRLAADDITDDDFTAWVREHAKPQ